MALRRACSAPLPWKRLRACPTVIPVPDLDILLLPQEGADLPALGGLLRRLEEKWGLRIDAEVALGSERYGKLAELLSGSGTILVKGGSDPVCVPPALSWHPWAAAVNQF